MKMRKCSKCEIEKPLTKEYYYEDKTKSEGFFTTCKECKKNYYQNNKEKRQEYQLEYAKNNKDYYKEYHKHYNKNKGTVKDRFNMKKFRGENSIEVAENNNIIHIDGYLKTNDNRKFTRLVGGFGENNPMVTAKQISELMELDLKVVNQTISRNINSFEYNTDILDFGKNNSVTQSDRLSEKDLENINYTKQSYANSKNIYVLSQSGFLLYLKFAEGDKAVSLYKDFIEDYFKTKVELQVAEYNLEKSTTTLQDTKAMLLGKVCMCSSEAEKMKMLMEIEKINTQILENEKTLAKQETLEQFKDVLEVADRFMNKKNCYDIGLFTKVLGIKGLGRNKMFSWLRVNNILRLNNEPYQRYADHFKVCIENKNNRNVTKTLIKPDGIKLILNKLKKEGYIKDYNISDIISNLETIA